MHPTRGGGSGRGSWRGSGWTHMPPLSTQPQANDEEHVAEEHVAEERVERDELPQLIPTVYWLSNPQVARAVTQSFRQHYRQAYLSWSETPEHVKNQWFRAFMSNFRCAAEHRNLAFQDWSRACQKRLKNHATTAGKDLTKKPVWMADDVWENFKKRREDPNFQARSKRHKDNKIRGSERDGNKIVAGHHQGSISSVELAQRMAVNEPVRDSYKIAYLLHFILGAGNLLLWNTFITAIDYFAYRYPKKHVERVFSVAYMSSSVLMLLLLIACQGSRKASFRIRMNVGFVLFFLSLTIAPVVGWAKWWTWSSFGSFWCLNNLFYIIWCFLLFGPRYKRVL